MKNKLIEICKKAKKASNQIIDNKIKNKVLLKFAHLVNKNKFKILSNNKKDVFNAKKNGLKNNMIERLELNEKKICLLYTSPSPRDRTRSRMPSSA